ncbi:MAG TPA: radical SAM protein [Micromonosporaceae bacterium]|nr:radical SAM protein [Micromonosporaceae bacterium]
MSQVVLDLVQHLGAAAAGATVEVPIQTGDADLVAAWCARTGNELIGIRDNTAVIRRGRALQDPELLPVARLWIYTNFDCNLACDYCCARSSPKAPRRAVGVDTIGRLVAEAGQTGVQEVFLTGGEPFLLPDLDQIVHACASRLPTTLLTNGMLFHGARLAMLQRMPRNNFTVQISLDAATPEQHDRHRGTGTWQKAINGVRIAQAEGFHVRVAATIAPAEADTQAQQAFHSLLDEMGISAQDQIVRPVAQRGFAAEGVTVTVETLLPEITVTAEGIFWHPVGADHPDQLVTRNLFPLADAIDEIRRRYTQYRRTITEAADRFPCA